MKRDAGIISSPECGEKRFWSMLALSLVLHAVAFSLFIHGVKGRISGPAVPFLDLDLFSAIRPAPSPQPSGETADTEREIQTPSPSDTPRVSSELDKLRENVVNSVKVAGAKPEIMDGDSLGLGSINGYFATIGDGETLRDDIREYYFEMLRQINRKWWMKGESKLAGRKQPVFYLVIARDGSIVDKIMVESSGNPDYDRTMLKTLEASNPLPPLPDSYRGEFFQAPLRFNAPLYLLKSLTQG